MSPRPGQETAPADPVMLAPLLRAHAAGLPAQVAAIDLLVAHRHWLTRPDFTARFVHPLTAGDGGPTGARIDWQAALAALEDGELPCSATQADMLRIAASLGAAVPLSLGHVLGGLDRANIAAVTTAITAANHNRT